MGRCFDPSETGTQKRKCNEDEWLFSQSAQTDGAVGGLRGDTADLLLSMETVGTLQGHHGCAEGLS